LRILQSEANYYESVIDQKRRDHDLNLKQIRDEHSVNINLENHQFSVTKKTIENKIINMESNIEDVLRQLNHYEIENLNLKDNLEMQLSETKSLITNTQNYKSNLEKEHRNDLIELSELVDEIEYMENNTGDTLEKLKDAHFEGIQE